MKINNSMSINTDQSLYQNEKVKTEEFKAILEKARHADDDKALLAATKDFESLFLQMIQKNMRSTISEDGFIQKSYDREIFEGMYDEKLSEEMAKGQGVGLAQQLYKQLSKQIKLENK